MKASEFVIPASLASLVLVLAHAASASPPSVYILMPSRPAALTAVSSALTTLGYKHAASIAGSNSDAPLLGLDPSTFAVLESGTAYMNISRANPEARFILPASATYSSWLGAPHDARIDDNGADSIRAFFAAESDSSQLLELDVLVPGSHDQAQSWVTLCDFLGLGYSVVERLKLWRFPQ
ncbi:hypothetical protein F4777DRAFT_4451 [Nemania sp. FL0916]|nr:hypothetical protein F4777DRAFT_4451 [Nemania sp. FL0916]